MDVITETDLPLKLFRKGKVREVYELDNNLFVVSTDRLSAFDVVFKEGIPHKGAVLNSLSIFWFLQTRDIVKNHFITNAVPATLPPYLEKRSMIVTRAKPIEIECVVRGHLAGSAWAEYSKSGTVCEIELPEGLKKGDELSHPIFTPSTKAHTGHDENITEAKACELVGHDSINFIKQKSIELYNFGRHHAKKCGLVLADTKFEFGFAQTQNSDKQIILIDELFTPDSSRYWLKEKYEQGILESFDKQYVRDYLEKTKWNKNPPAPALPQDVIENTSKIYLQAYSMLTGKEIAYTELTK